MTMSSRSTHRRAGNATLAAAALLAAAGQPAPAQADISEAGDGNKDQTRIDTMIGRGANVFHAPQTRTAPGVQTGLPVVAALADRMLLAWPERVGADTWHLRLAAHPSGGGWGPTRTFADLDGWIAIAASRRSALVLWQPFQPYAEQRVLQLAVYRP